MSGGCAVITTYQLETSSAPPWRPDLGPKSGPNYMQSNSVPVGSCAISQGIGSVCQYIWYLSGFKPSHCQLWACVASSPSQEKKLSFKARCRVNFEVTCVVTLSCRGCSLIGCISRCHQCWCFLSLWVCLSRPHFGEGLIILECISDQLWPSLFLKMYVYMWNFGRWAVWDQVQNFGPVKTLNTDLSLYNKPCFGGSIISLLFAQMVLTAKQALAGGEETSHLCPSLFGCSCRHSTVYCWGRIWAWTIRIEPLLYIKRHRSKLFSSFKCFSESEASGLIHYKAFDVAVILVQYSSASSSQEKCKVIDIIHRKHI